MEALASVRVGQLPGWGLYLMRSLGRHTSSFLILHPDSHEIRVAQRHVGRRIVNPVEKRRVSRDFGLRSGDSNYRSVHVSVKPI